MTKTKEKIMQFIFLIIACISVVSVCLICLFLLWNGFPAMAEIGLFKFLFGTTWSLSRGVFGVFPMILGSLYATGGAIALGVPVALLAAVYMARFCPGWLYKILRPMIDILAAVPSVVYGYFAMAVIVPFIRENFGAKGQYSGKSILAASVLLAIMILPTIIAVSESALRAVPGAYYEGALALGATPEQGQFFVVFPAAKSGILAGVALGVARAIGEATAVAMVVGNQPRIPGSILEGVRTLTTNIILEMGYSAGLHRQALIATGIVLFVFILLINFALAALRRGGSK